MVPQLHIDTRDLTRWAAVYESMPRAMAQKVIARTLNWVGDRARTKKLRTMAQRSSIPYGDIRDTVKTLRARPGNRAYELIAIGEALPLRAFSPVRSGKGVSARVWGKRRTYRGAFIVESIGGHVFRRVSKARLPIQKVWGPAVPKEMHTKEAIDAFEKEVRTRLDGRLRHEMGRALYELSAQHSVAKPPRPN
jgi:hypothetical protein